MIDEQCTGIHRSTVVELEFETALLSDGDVLNLKIVLGCIEFDSGGEVIGFFAAFPFDVAPHAGLLLGQYWGVLQ